MRRLIILALLVAGIQLLSPLGSAGHGAQSLLTFGFLILAAYTSGEMAHAAGLPRIIGYLASGILFGPSLLNTVTVDATQQLEPVTSLAVALIAFLAGAELQWQEVRSRIGVILKIMGTELTITFLALVGLLLALRAWVPFLQGQPLAVTVAFSVLFASIAIVHSPAVTMALLSETGARGPVARTTLGIVLVSDVVVVLLFTGAIALARAIVPSSSADAPALSLGTAAWEIGGAVIVGSVLGGAVSLYLRFVRRELFLFAILIAFFGVELARLLHTEALLTLLTAGFVAENVSPSGGGEALRHAMERSAAPVFVVFFALAGASIGFADLAAVWPLVIPIVAVRALSVWLGSNLGARWAGVQRAEGRFVWMGLISQAGVAVGLATIVAEVYPTRGAQVRVLFLAVIAVHELAGPILFRRALVKSGEVKDAAASNRRGVQASPSPSIVAADG